MSTTANNTTLSDARQAKQDEFYTQLVDIENELKNYEKHFKGKTVYCNCDDPRVSNFFHYFSYNYDRLGLKKLLATCYKSQTIDLFSQNDSETAIYLEYHGEKDGGRVPTASQIQSRALKGDGDFRSDECVALLKEADIVVTNPPFSLFRDYLGHLVKHKKHFIVLGNQNAITYKEVFSLIRDDKLWLGCNSGQMSFKVPDYYEPRKSRFWVDDDGQKWRSFGNMCWFTNLDHAKRHEELVLYATYSSDTYPQFDNYEAINVDRVAEIPQDYAGVMGVPITFLHKYSPKQFEIVGLAAGNIRGLAGIPSSTGKDGPYIDGTLKYGRIMIRRK